MVDLQLRCLVSLWLLEDAAAARLIKAMLPYCSNLNYAGPDAAYTALTSAASRGRLQAMRLLHAAGASVHFESSSGSAMHMAAQSGSVAEVKWLLAAGVGTHSLDADGMLPLHTACNWGKAELVRYLLDLPDAAASDLHAQSHKGLAPLHCAARAEAGGDSVVHLLLQRRRAR
jgi:ankyrin